MKQAGEEADKKEAKREPVDYLYSGLNWNFIKAMARIARYATEKYGSAEQYADSEFTGEKSPINHIPEHLRSYWAAEGHDHFGEDPSWHLVAIAYNCMMEFLYASRRGVKASKLAK